MEPAIFFEKYLIMDDQKNSVVKELQIRSLFEKQSDYEFWKEQPFQKRLEALETLRQQYILWKYGTKQRFQRVYKIIKLS